MAKRLFLPGLSRLDVAANCVYPWTSGIKWPKDHEDNQYRTFGSAVSVAAECIATWGDYPHDEIVALFELVGADSKRLVAAANEIRGYLEPHDDEWRKCETGFAIDPMNNTARELTNAERFDYSGRGEFEFSGVLDLLRMTRSGVLRIDEYKTGSYKYGTSPKDIFQLTALGAAVAKAYGVREIDIARIQLKHDGTLMPAVDTMTEWDIEFATAKLAVIVQRIQRGEFEPKPGWWCNGAYCKIQSVCPVTQSIWKLVEPQVPVTGEIRSIEQASLLAERLPMMEEAVKVMKSALNEYNKHRPIPVTGGKLRVLSEIETRRIDLTRTETIDILREALGDYGFSRAVSYETSAEAIKDAVRLSAEKGKLGKTVDKIMDRLQEAGAIKLSSFVKPKLINDKRES